MRRRKNRQVAPRATGPNRMSLMICIYIHEARLKGVFFGRGLDVSRVMKSTFERNNGGCRRMIYRTHKDRLGGRSLNSCLPRTVAGDKNPDKIKSPAMRENPPKSPDGFSCSINGA